MSKRAELNNLKLLRKCWKKLYWSKSAAKKKNSKGIDGVTIESFYKEESLKLASMLNQLKQDTFHLSPLYGFKIKKEGKEEYRLITAATVTDRIIHKAILCILSECLYDYINTGVSYCGVKKNLLSEDDDPLNAKKAIRKLIDHVETGHFWIVKADIKGFYDNVPKRSLFNVITKLSKDVLQDTSLNGLLKDIIYFEIGNIEDIKRENKKLISEGKLTLPLTTHGISQGSSLSQFFANIYLADIDRRMHKKYGDRFIRYIDDFIIVCRTEAEAKQARLYIEELLRRKNLALAADKTDVLDLRKKGFNFLGLKITKEGISWKRDKHNLKSWALDVLNPNNYILYQDSKGFLQKAEKMNQRLQGVEEYLKYYHTWDEFQDINKQIKHKRRRKSYYKKIRLLDVLKIKPVVPLKKWKSFFTT